MFENLQERFGRVLNNLRGQGRLTEDNIKDTLREVRMALLEADVALPVVRAVRRAGARQGAGRGGDASSLTPGQVLIKIVNDELVALMGAANEAPGSDRPAAGGGADGGPAGLGQDHQRRQARPLAPGEAEKDGHGGQLRRLPPGGHRAVADAWRRRSGAEFFPSSGDQDPVAHRPAGPGRGPQALQGRADRRYRRPAACRRRR